MEKLLNRRKVFTIKITLSGIRPPIWRRVVVPDNEALSDLHYIIQIAMGWDFSHLHEFQVGERLYGEPDSEFQEVKVLPDWNVKLSTIYRRGIRNFTYLYDFGDSWHHKIVIENVQPLDPNESYPLLLGGRRNCPPEDVGGVPGYSEFLKAKKDPTNPEYSDFAEWYEGEFDPEKFDQEAIGKHLIHWAMERFSSSHSAQDIHQLLAKAMK